VSNEKVKIGIALAAGLCIGGGAGYLYAEKKIRSKTEKEIADVRAMFDRLREEDAAQARADWNPDAEEETDVDGEDYADADPEALETKVKELNYGDVVELTPRHVNPKYVGGLVKDRNYVAPSEKDPEELREEAEVRNIRIVNPNRDNDPNDVTQWDRDPDHPYVITDQEFRIDRQEFEKLSLTYYRGDDTLAEADGTYIPDQDGTAGDENLHNHFGLVSGDPLLLHVRNERVGADFEITLDEGSYRMEVLGFAEEDRAIKASKRGIKKMRSHE
jgi:hypothetical protein